MEFAARRYQGNYFDDGVPVLVQRDLIAWLGFAFRIRDASRVFSP